MKEFICDSCNGTGFIKVTGTTMYGCPKCKFFKKLNWLEMIFGKLDYTNEEYMTAVQKVRADIRNDPKVIITNEQRNN